MHFVVEFKMGERLQCLLVSFFLVFGVGAYGEKSFVLNEYDSVKYDTCDDVLGSGQYESSGPYMIYLNSSEPLKVHCRFELGSGYTSIMQQKYGRVSFERPWYDYVRGFGNQALGDFWLGLEHIQRLANLMRHRVLTVTMQDWNNIIKRVQYRRFELVGDEFKLYLSRYESGAILPDDFSHNNGVRFATYDRPDLHKCASHQKAGWWYNYCTYALPTGHYYHGGMYQPSGKFYDGIYFSDWHGMGYSLKYIKLELSYN